MTSLYNTMYLQIALIILFIDIHKALETSNIYVRILRIQTHITIYTIVDIFQTHNKESSWNLTCKIVVLNFLA